MKGKWHLMLNYPIIEGDETGFPDGFVCPVCREAKVWEPHTFVSLDGGALKMDRGEDSGGPSDELDGFLYLGWHGAHDEGEGDFRETGGFVPIVQGVLGGQYSVVVCSPACVRRLFNVWVDELESRMKNAVSLEP